MFERSFAILRTNPMLTTNVKLVIDSSQNLYLESFPISKQLSEDRFKHYAVKQDEYLFDVLPAFWEGVEATVAFGPLNNSDYDAMYDDFQYQFDDTYFSGSAATQDTWYSEQFEYHAPVWLKKGNLPKGFMILRIDGPGLNDGNSPYNFRTDVLNKWKIVTHVDLTTSNNFGNFINQQLNYVYFPETPTTINYTNLRFSIFNGIDFYKSGYAQKYLDFEPIRSLQSRIFQLEENITNKWRDLGLIFPNIFNLKFLYDDTPATPTSLRTWSINRYMGFYIDDVTEIKSISPYKPFNLKKTPNEKLEALTPLQVSELPYVLNNTIVQDINGRRYTFDPIEGDWKDGQTYYIEWNGKYYKLSKEVNDNSNVLGKYQYKIISDVNITYAAPSDVTNVDLINQYTKVLLNELSTLKYQIQIVDNLFFENISAQNVIQNVNSTYTSLNRVFQQYSINGQLVWGFKIQLVSDINNNLFSIDNFNDLDLCYIEINGQKSVIKQYPASIPNIGGLYYLQTDYAINVNSRISEQWINNGNVSKDSKYYNSQDIETVDSTIGVIFYNIYYVSFTDIKDFDFERMDTDYAQYEYEKTTSLPDTLEHKLYAKERRPLSITLYQPLEINSSNYSNSLLLSYFKSDPFTYQQWLNQYTQPIQRSPIGVETLPVTLYFDNFDDYANFKYTQIISGVIYYVNGIAFNENITTYKAQMPLYVFPRRIPILDINNQPATDPVTGEKQYQLDINGNYVYTTESAFKKIVIPNNREYYREEGYIFLQSDVDPIQSIDFYTKKEPDTYLPTLTWDQDFPMAKTMKWSPYKTSVEDPNQQLDPCYLPVTSEYIASEEIWEIRNNSNLSPIWDKNQNICKWGFMNSLDTHDYPYRMSFDLEISGLYNNSCNPFSSLDFATRKFRDLDYFYRLGIDSNNESLSYLSLHLKEPFFDLDKYFDNNFDYFDYVFKSDYLTDQGLKTYKKYSLFDFGDGTESSLTLFKGIKWRIYDVASVVFDKNYPTQSFVQDYNRISSSFYNGYKFSIIMGRKLSTFKYLAGDNDGDFGIDIIINEVYKNILVFIYFETDQTVTFGRTLSDNSVVQLNLETSNIDLVYEADQIISESVDATLWQNGQLKIDGTQDIGKIRVRDLKLFNVLALLNEKNYKPSNGSGRAPVRYVRIKADNSVSVMNTSNTDFVIDAELPEQFLIKEKTFKTNTSQPLNLDITNSVKNTIIIDDDPNAPSGDPNKTAEGALVNSVLDINAWDGMPIGRSFVETDVDDRREYYNLDSDIDPIIYRHSGPYAPIFRDLKLFRPMSYWSLTSSTSNVTSLLDNRNLKFYDDFSDNQTSGPAVHAWGYVPELIFSKVNRQGNILKLALDGDTKTKSLYPMVDEYGYDFGARYVFQSTWDRNFFMESRNVVLSKNVYPNFAGYTVYLNGYDNRLKINDNIKFSIVPSGYDNVATLLPGDNITLPNTILTQISLNNLDPVKKTIFHLKNVTTGQVSQQYFFIPNGTNPPNTNIAVDSLIGGVIFTPTNINTSDMVIQSGLLLEYIPYLYTDDLTNTNGHNFTLNRENSASGTVFASAHLTVEPINGKIYFEMNTNTRGLITYDYFISSNVPREIFAKQFSIPTFVSDSNTFLNPDYTMTDVTGDINNLSFNIKSTVAGAAYNFKIQNAINAVENIIMHIDAPASFDYVEKGVSSLLQYVGQNSELTSFTNKAARSFTIEFWIKSDGFTKHNETIIYKGSDDLNDTNILNDFSYIIRRHGDTGKLEFVTNSYIVSDDFDITSIVPYDGITFTGTPLYQDTLVSNTDIDDGQFHYVAFVFDTDNKKKYIYVDQYQDAIVENVNLNNHVVDPDPGIENKNWHIYIGSDYQNGVLNFTGSLDELRIWNYARSKIQIQSNYNLRLTPTSYLDPFKSLVAYYRFDEQAGVLQIVDYSESIFELERISIISQNLTSNGVQNITINNTSFLQNEVSFFSQTPILVTDVNIKWVVSGANLKGISDERYTISLPVATTKKTVADLPVVIAPRSKFVGTFQPSISPVPRPQPAPNPVKVVTLDDNLKRRPKAIRLMPHRIKYHVLRYKYSPVYSRFFNDFDPYNARWIYLNENDTVDDNLRLFEREDIIDQSPLDYINDQTPISNNEQEKRVTFSQNKSTGVTSQYSSLVFKPINNLLRRI